METNFKPLFKWNGDKLEDVRFWCEPSLTRQAIETISSKPFPAFDGFVSFEARGFFLAGMASAICGLPVLPIRKHKSFYDKMAHEKISFQNWKGESETLTVLKDSLPSLRRVLVIDDILDTGRSLKAGESLLRSMGIDIVGAFYLLNAGSKVNLSSFSFPIHSILEHKLL
jgi:adenine phosphoribosyltransferase